MKYIPGYSFTVGVTNEAPKKGGSLMDQRNKNSKRSTEFDYGCTYTIFNIKPLDKKVIYTFKTNIPLMAIIDMEFESIGEAEAKISKIVGL